MAKSGCREIPDEEWGGGEVTGGGFVSGAPSPSDRSGQTGETQHAVYLTTLSVRTYHIHHRETGERIAEKERQKKSLFPPQNNDRAVQGDLCDTKVSQEGTRALFYVSVTHCGSTDEAKHAHTHTLGYSGYLPRPIRDLNFWLSANSKDINILRSVTDSIWCASRPIISLAVTWILCLYIRTKVELTPK